MSGYSVLQNSDIMSRGIQIELTEQFCGYKLKQGGASTNVCGTTGNDNRNAFNTHPIGDISHAFFCNELQNSCMSRLAIYPIF